MALAIVVLAAGFNYRYMFDVAMVMFASPIEDMSHGWLVPFFSLFVVWSQRKELRAAAEDPCWRGVAWTVFFLAVAWLGGRGGQTRLEQVSFIGLVWAVPYAFWGARLEKYLRFPAAYLAFTIPVSSFVDFFTIHLRIWSSALATGLLNGVGVAVERSGTALFSRVPGATFNVDVADPCSGIRSLFAMMALTAAYAYLTQKTTGRKWALFACAVPIAMLGNMVRIMSICLVAAGFGQEVATGYYHDYSGYVVFLVGVLLMIKSGDLIQKYAEKVGRWMPGWGGWQRKKADRAGTAAGESTAKPCWIVGGVCMVSVSVFIGIRMTPPPTFDAASFAAPALPARVGEFDSDVPWFCHNPQCLTMTEERELVNRGQLLSGGFMCPVCGQKLSGVSLGESADLPKDTTIIKRNYRAPDGLVYAVNVVIGGRSRGSIHRAELCLPAQGFVMLDAGRLPLQLSEEKKLMVRKITINRPGGGAQSLVYWFLSEKREVCSHTQRILLDVWDRSIHNQINRWVMIAISVSSELDSPESKERFAAFLHELYPCVAAGRRGVS